MTKEEILKVRDTAEQTRVQFKERVTRDNKYDVGGSTFRDKVRDSDMSSW